MIGPALMAEESIPSDTALKETSFALTVFGKLFLAQSVTVTSTAAGVGGVVEVVASVVTQKREHLFQFALMLPKKSSAQDLS